MNSIQLGDLFTEEQLEALTDAWNNRSSSRSFHKRLPTILSMPAPEGIEVIKEGSEVVQYGPFLPSYLGYALEYAFGQAR